MNETKLRKSFNLLTFAGVEDGKPVFLVGFDKVEEELLTEKRKVLEGITIMKPLIDRRLYCYARSILSWNKRYDVIGSLKSEPTGFDHCCQRKFFLCFIQIL